MGISRNQKKEHNLLPNSVQCYASSAEQKDGSIPNRKGGRRSFLFRKLDRGINSLHSLELRKESQIGEGV